MCSSTVSLDVHLSIARRKMEGASARHAHPFVKGVTNFCEASSFWRREGDDGSHVKNYIINFRPFWDETEASQRVPYHPFRLVIGAGSYNSICVVIIRTESSFSETAWCVLMLRYQFRSLMSFLSCSYVIDYYNFLFFKFDYSIALHIPRKHSYVQWIDCFVTSRAI